MLNDKNCSHLSPIIPLLFVKLGSKQLISSIYYGTSVSEIGIVLLNDYDYDGSVESC